MKTSPSLNEASFPLVSVIVPIFKVEQYLRRCIDSILNQTYPNLEVILVDDGSPDRCGQICDDYAGTDQRIKVIHKPNGGLSDARNAGIEIATGDFIGFVDSDDFIHPEMYQTLYELLVNNQADIAQCSFQRVVDDGFKDPGPDSGLKILKQTEALEYLFTYSRVDYIVAWNKLYRKQLFNEIRYPKSKIHEDEATTYKLFYLSEKIAITGKKFYYYFQSPNSIIRSTFNEKKLHYAEAMEERLRFFKKKQLYEFYTRALKGYAQWLLLFMFRNRKALKSLPEIKSDLKKKYRNTHKLISMDSAIGNRSKSAFRCAVYCPALGGLLIYHRQYKNNLIGRLAVLTGLIDE